MTTYRKKLIEVALPLEAINKESAREKSIRHGHPSTLHLWWARRPLAACRAVLFSSLVNDPEDDPMYGVDKEIAYTERAKLFNLIEELVKWENSNNPRVINAARLEIARSIAANKVADKELKDDTPLVANAPRLPEEQEKYLPDSPSEYTPHDVRFKMPSLRPEQVNHFLAHYAPPVLDPFAGGGSIPLEAQRLGLRAYASDLNPVPVLINKALIEIPPKFAGLPPVNPDARKGKLKNAEWRGAQGLAEDVRYYGKWMRDEAEKRIGHLYPKVKVTEEMAADRPDLEPYVGKELTVIAWLWARTVKSPNPAAEGAYVPLIKSFWLRKKKGHEAYVAPVIDRTNNQYQFSVELGVPDDGFDPNRGTVDRRGGRCILTDEPFPLEYVRTEGANQDIHTRLTAMVLNTPSGRAFISPSDLHEECGRIEFNGDAPESDVPAAALGFRVHRYGLDKHRKLFTGRQLHALTCFRDLLSEVHEQVSMGSTQLRGDAYANAVCTYLAFAVDRGADYWSSLATWEPNSAFVGHTFTKPTLSMVWDFAEANPIGGASGDWCGAVDWIARVVERTFDGCVGIVTQRDARTACDQSTRFVVSTDPPYYDNIGYADLSDYFYVWLRGSVGHVYPDLFSTVLTPKSDELIADPSKHSGSRDASKRFFERGLRATFESMRANHIAEIPMTVVYGFKQTEAEIADADGGQRVASTGWETMLDALIGSGFVITGTWPVRSERGARSRAIQSNALSSSVVLVSRRRADDAGTVPRRDFATALRKELPEAIKHLQSGNVAPVDLAQASIGPGMAVFSQYKQVVNADGSPMSVREALQMINQVLDEALNEQEADFDSETRFAVRWFEQYGMTEGPFGDAETLAKAMAVAVSGVVEAGILASKSGKVRLLKRDELDAKWNPKTDRRSTIWECTQHLIRRLESDGESAAAQLLTDIQQAKNSEAGEVARELSYRLYSTCERKSRATDALSYNGLVVSWPEISRLARDLSRRGPHETQQEMFSE